MRKEKITRNDSVELFAAKGVCVCGCGCNGFTCSAIPTHDYGEKQQIASTNSRTGGRDAAYGVD